jgi:hypothetical protein
MTITTSDMTISAAEFPFSAEVASHDACSASTGPNP